MGADISREHDKFALPARSSKGGSPSIKQDRGCDHRRPPLRWFSMSCTSRLKVSRSSSATGPLRKGTPRTAIPSRQASYPRNASPAHGDRNDAPGNGRGILPDLGEVGAATSPLARTFQPVPRHGSYGLSVGMNRRVPRSHPGIVRPALDRPRDSVGPAPATGWRAAAPITWMLVGQGA